MLPLVYKDPLTGLYNRRGFLEEGGKIFQAVLEGRKHKGRRKNFLIKNLSLIFIDLDDFKKINDVFGHEAGDFILKRFAEILKENFRSSDLIGRWGGEEALALLAGAVLKDACKIAEALRQKIQESVFKFKGKKMKLTASFGVAEIKEKGIKIERKLEELIAKADKAMYRAKKKGKNKVITL